LSLKGLEGILDTDEKKCQTVSKQIPALIWIVWTVEPEGIGAELSIDGDESVGDRWTDVTDFADVTDVTVTSNLLINICRRIEGHHRRNRPPLFQKNTVAFSHSIGQFMDLHQKF